MEDIYVVKKIAEYSHFYREVFLAQPERRKPVTAVDSLLFILGISLFQGRRDSISKVYFNLISRYLRSNEVSKAIHINPSMGKIEREYFKNIYADIYNELNHIGIKKGADRVMIINLIGLNNWLIKEKGINIVQYIVFSIENGSIENIYKFLDNVFSIGDKIASLILRDIVSIYNLEGVVNSIYNNNAVYFYAFMQPIDTWVHQVSLELGIVNKEKIFKNEAYEIVRYCIDHNINPIEFNSGAWYFGSQAFKAAIQQFKEEGKKQLDKLS